MATYTDNYSLIKPSYSEIADVATINTNMNTIDDIMHSTQISLAPAYDSAKTYNIGDVVMYELLMYKCKENNVTGTWNASKWERTTASATGGGGGGGGSSVSYGYDNPETAGSDGDVYYALNSSDELVGTWLYIVNQWKLIDGSPITHDYILYNYGVEGVAWDAGVGGATKNSDNISLSVGGGNYTSYAVTNEAIDVTDYDYVTLNVRYRDQTYTTPIDISNYTGLKYISFTYLTDNNHNEVAIGLSDTKTSAVTLRIDSRNGGTAEGKMYYLGLA